jgi:HK97 family phage major capsid protein
MPASPLEALQFERNTLQARASALLQMDAATGAPIPSATSPTAEEIAEATAINAQVRTLDARIEAMEATRAMQRNAPAVSAREPAHVRERFEDDPKRGFASIGHFAKAVKEQGDLVRTGYGMSDPRLVHARDAARADDADGADYRAAAPSTLQREGGSTEGFMVPPDFLPGIWRPAFEMDDLLAMVNPKPTSGNSVQFYADESTPWGAQGIVAYWVAEAGQLTATKLPTKAGELKLDKLACLVYVTDELLEDAPLITARIDEAAPQAIAWTVGEAIMRGNGVGKPLGWEAGTVGGANVARVSIAKETSQAAASIVPKNLGKMYGRLLRGPGARVLWFANADIVPELMDLKIGNEPSWIGQNKGLQDAPNGMLLSAPIHFSEHCKTLGTTGDIQLINLAGYAAFIKSSGTRFDSSIHLYFDYMVTAFRWAMRVGGQPLLSAPQTPANGSATKSHYVYLDTRS